MNISRLWPRLYYLTKIFLVFFKVSNKVSLITNLPKLIANNGNVKIGINTIFITIRNLYELYGLSEIFYNQDYFPIFNNLPDKTTFIDIGAFIGDTVIYSQQFKNIQQTIAVEPNPENIDLLKQNLRDNKIKLSKIIPMAVLDKNENNMLYIHHNNRGQTGLNTKTNSQYSASVDTVTLKQVISFAKYKKIIVKCDCEGSEYEIFAKTPLLILKKINRIIMEYHVNNRKLSEIKNHLKKAGFTISSQKNRVEQNLGILYAYR